MAGGGAAVEALRERVARLEELLGAASIDSNASVADRLENVAVNVEALSQNLAAFIAETQDKHAVLGVDLVAFSDSMKNRMLAVEGSVDVLRQTTHNQASSSTVEVLPSKIKVPDPKPFDGARNAKELENFLWDMEQYFMAAHCSDREKVMITSMYLIGDAKLWWRTRMQDDEHADRPRIETWECLKRELKAQFLPCNTGWLAREALKNLKHTGSVRDYVMEFSSLMLDISNMSEEDKLFNFVTGLQGWAQTELRRQNVKTLPAAVAAAEGLMDYMIPVSFSSERRKIQEAVSSKGSKESQGSKASNNGSERRWKEGDVSKARWAESSQEKGNKTFGGCFICSGPHRARDCPKKQPMRANAVVEEGVDAEDISLRCAPMMLLDRGSLKEGKTQTSVGSMRTSNSRGVGGLLDP